MKFMDKVWGSLGLVEQTEPEEESPRDEADGKKKGNVVSIASSSAKQTPVKVVVVEPFSFDDVKNIADHLKNRKPVVVNFENTEKEVAKRMVDFISGTTYAISGSIQKIGASIFLCAPNNVDIAYCPREETPDKTLFPWGGK